MNDTDGPGDLKDLPGFLRQVVTDGRDPVRVLNGVAGDGEVGLLNAHQSDIGAVQGGDHGKAGGGFQNPLGQKSRDRVRDRVVYVQKIQAVAAGHF